MENNANDSKEQVQQAIVIFNNSQAELGKQLTTAITSFFTNTFRVMPKVAEFASLLNQDEYRLLSFDKDFIEGGDTLIRELSNNVAKAKDVMKSYNDSKLRVTNLLEKAFNSVMSVLKEAIVSKTELIKSYETSKAKYFKAEEERIAQQKRVEILMERFKIGLESMIKIAIVQALHEKVSKIMGAIKAWEDDTKLNAFLNWVSDAYTNIALPAVESAVKKARETKLMGLPDDSVEFIINQVVSDTERFTVYAKQESDNIIPTLTEQAYNQIEALKNKSQELQAEAEKANEDASIVAELTEMELKQELQKTSAKPVAKLKHEVTFSDTIDKQHLKMYFEQWLNSEEFDVKKLQFIPKFLERHLNNGGMVINTSTIEIEQKAKNVRIRKNDS